MRLIIDGSNVVLHGILLATLGIDEDDSRRWWVGWHWLNKHLVHIVDAVEKVSIVYDSEDPRYEEKGRHPYRNVSTRFVKDADAKIVVSVRKLVKAGNEVCVVTDDQELQTRCTLAGAEILPSRSFIELLVELERLAPPISAEEIVESIRSRFKMANGNDKTSMQVKVNRASDQFGFGTTVKTNEGVFLADRVIAKMMELADVDVPDDMVGMTFTLVVALNTNADPEKRKSTPWWSISAEDLVSRGETKECDQSNTPARGVYSIVQGPNVDSVYMGNGEFRVYETGGKSYVRITLKGYEDPGDSGGARRVHNDLMKVTDQMELYSGSTADLDAEILELLRKKRDALRAQLPSDGGPPIWGKTYLVHEDGKNRIVLVKADEEMEVRGVCVPMFARRAAVDDRFANPLCRTGRTSATYSKRTADGQLMFVYTSDVVVESLLDDNGNRVYVEHDPDLVSGTCQTRYFTLALTEPTIEMRRVVASSDPEGEGFCPLANIAQNGGNEVPFEEGGDEQVDEPDPTVPPRAPTGKNGNGKKKEKEVAGTG